MPLRRLLAVSTVLAAAVAFPAVASDPSEGTVSPASPKFAWTGNVEASTVGYFLYTTAGESPSGSCEAPHCDTFTLKVDGGGNLTLTAESDTAGVNEIDIALEKSDGSVVVFSGAGKAKGTIKALPAGTYPVYVWGVVGASSGNIAFDYKASAELPATAAPAPAPAGGPAPAPGAGGSPQPAPAAPATLTVKAPKASARKLNKSRRLTVKVSASGQVKNLVATLTKGKRKVGTAKLAGFEGTGSVAIRLAKKLKAGRYAVKVTATDAASGKPVATSAKVRVKR